MKLELNIFAGTMAEASAQAARFLGPGGEIPRPVRPAGHTLMELGKLGGAEDLHLRIRTYASGELAFGRNRDEVKAELVAVGWPERLIEQLVPSRREEPLVAFVSGHIALGTSPRKLERCLLAQGVDQTFVTYVVGAARSATARANRRLGGWLAATGSAALMASAGATWVWDAVARPVGAVLLAVGGALGLAGTLAGLALTAASWSWPRRTSVL